MMDAASMSSDSEGNSYSGLMEFNLHGDSLDTDLSKFNDFPDLLAVASKKS